MWLNLQTEICLLIDLSGPKFDRHNNFIFARFHVIPNKICDKRISCRFNAKIIDRIFRTLDYFKAGNAPRRVRGTILFIRNCLLEIQLSYR